MISAVREVLVSEGPSLTLSPNPFTDAVYLSLGEQEPLRWERLVVTDMQGRTVLNQTVPVPSYVHLGYLPEGMYAFVLYDEEWRVIDSGKAVKGW